MKYVLPIVSAALAFLVLSFACSSPEGAPVRGEQDATGVVAAGKAVASMEAEPTAKVEDEEKVMPPTASQQDAVPESESSPGSRSTEEPRQMPSSTIRSRINAPPGYERLEAAPNTFAAYLQHLPLKPGGTEVRYYNGRIKENRGVYIAVVDIDVGARDLQQCADAVMRLRAEHLWAQQAYDDIHFNFSNGFRVDYLKWREGYRVKIDGNRTNWYKAAGTDTSYRSFRRYMDLIFAYAGTWSLSKELNKVNISDLQIGDVFIQGGSPGHAVIVVDMAVQPRTGRKVFLLAQSYMPAQDIQILQNPVNDALNPWYALDFGETLYTPEWRFRAGDLMRFP